MSGTISTRSPSTGSRPRSHRDGASRVPVVHQASQTVCGPRPPGPVRREAAPDRVADPFRATSSHRRRLSPTPAEDPHPGATPSSNQDPFLVDPARLPAPRRPHRTRDVTPPTLNGCLHLIERRQQRPPDIHPTGSHLAPTPRRPRSRRGPGTPLDLRSRSARAAYAGSRRACRIQVFLRHGSAGRGEADVGHPLVAHDEEVRRNVEAEPSRFRRSPPDAGERVGDGARAGTAPDPLRRVHPVLPVDDRQPSASGEVAVRPEAPEPSPYLAR